MDKQYTSVEEQVEFGLDSVDPARTVEVPLRDLLYVHQTLGEYVRFFHDPAHSPDLAAVHRFLGSSHAGYDGGPFDNPASPTITSRPAQPKTCNTAGAVGFSVRVAQTR